MILLILENLYFINFDTIISIFDVRLQFWFKFMKYLMQNIKITKKKW